MMARDFFRLLMKLSHIGADILRFLLVKDTPFVRILSSVNLAGFLQTSRRLLIHPIINQFLNNRGFSQCRCIAEAAVVILCHFTQDTPHNLA